MIDPDVIHRTIERGEHTVLVVDDNAATRYATARVLRAAEFRTLEAGSGSEALAMSRQGVSAVVLDVHLPDIDGFEVCRLVRSRLQTTTLPIVHLSATFIRQEDHVTGLNAGADAYLVHPVEPAVLIATLQALIRARLAEEELRRSLEREQAARAVAERHSRTKDDFIAVLSHELRSPLNAIMGWVHVLKRRGVTADGMRGLDAIERNVKTQARLISDILDVSRINSGKLRLEREWVDPVELVNAWLTAMTDMLQEKRLELEADVEGARQPAWLDPARFQQIFWNLLTNAIKFSPEGARVRVALSRQGERLHLRVQDWGIGIEPEHLAHVFDRFAQLDAPGNRTHGGLGLGLAIVKHLAELHGGSTCAESAGQGRGTTMHVELSAVPSAAVAGETLEAAAVAGAETDAAGTLAGIRVLVVEDDADASEMMVLVLQDRGAAVRCAPSCDAALEALGESWPDVLVSDIGLPGRDGCELLREVRALQADSARRLPAIALTAFTRLEDRERSLGAGFDVHLSKPLQPHALVRAIRQLVMR